MAERREEAGHGRRDAIDEGRTTSNKVLVDRPLCNIRYLMTDLDHVLRHKKYFAMDG